MEVRVKNSEAILQSKLCLEDMKGMCVGANHKLKTIGWLAVAVVGLTLGLKFAFPVLAPFFLGVVFAGLIEPLVLICETRLQLRRSVATPVFLLLLMLLVLTLVTVTLILTYQEAQHLWKLIPLWGGRLADLAHRWLFIFQPCFPELQRFARLFFNPELFSQISRPILFGLVSSLPRFPQIVVVILLGVVSAYFFSRDKRVFIAWTVALIPADWQRPLRELQKEAAPVLARFLRLECGLVLVTMAVTFACLRLLGMGGAATYSWLAGVFDLVPVLGPGLIYLPIFLSCLLAENYFGAIIVLSGYFLLLVNENLRRQFEYSSFNDFDGDLYWHEMFWVAGFFLRSGVADGLTQLLPGAPNRTS
jgi:predicted PurR-regulated permease PerM